MHTHCSLTHVPIEVGEAQEKLLHVFFARKAHLGGRGGVGGGGEEVNLLDERRIDWCLLFVLMIVIIRGTLNEKNTKRKILK